MKSMTLCAALALLIAGPPLHAQPQFIGGLRAVKLQPAGDLDPCSRGRITTAGDGAVLVYPGDSVALDSIDYLSGGEKVWLCETSENSDMVGIVYGPDPYFDCELGSPVRRETPYPGPCWSGWVRAQWVELIAG